jgi:hypothetical protein
MGSHIDVVVEGLGNGGIVEKEARKEKEALEASPQAIPSKEAGELQDVLEEAPSKEGSGKP